MPPFHLDNFGSKPGFYIWYGYEQGGMRRSCPNYSHSVIRTVVRGRILGRATPYRSPLSRPRERHSDLGILRAALINSEHVMEHDVTGACRSKVRRRPFAGTPSSTMHNIQRETAVSRLLSSNLLCRLFVPTNRRRSQVLWLHYYCCEGHGGCRGMVGHGPLPPVVDEHGA